MTHKKNAEKQTNVTPEVTKNEDFNPKGYFTTLQRDKMKKNKLNIALPVEGYLDLLNLQKALLNICSNALLALGNDLIISDTIMDIYRILEIVKESLPSAESEYLDRIANIQNTD
jgi:hypothetical protein